MTDSPERSPNREAALELALDVAMRLAVVAFLIGMCLTIIRPFAVLILWAIILAVALSVPFEKLVGIVGKRGRAATIMSLVSAAAILFPAYLMGSSLIETVNDLRGSLEAGTLEAPAPKESVQNLPVVGERIYSAWQLAHEDIQQAVEQFEPQLRAAGAWAVDFLRGVGGAMLQTLVALIIASVLLTYRESGVGSAKAIARRLAPDGGDDYVTMAGATINSVTQGVLGVAAIQGVLTLALLIIAGMPFAALIAVAMFVVATLQLPGLIVMIVPILWSLSNMGGAASAAFIVAAIVVGAIDTPLKAVLLGRGLPVPTFVILIGAIGGMVSMGMMGLFVGAVLLCLGYRLLVAWTGGGSPTSDISEPGESVAPA